MKFRELRADELEARIASAKSDKGVSILLYKNARCDMNVLDETVGALNWQRDHKDLKGRMYAGIGIYDDEKGEWIWKWDCGKESYTEGEKGEASDSFKRAGFNWGIGRELYTAPFIWFKADDVKWTKEGKCYDTFTVNAIEYANGRISYVKVTDNKSKKFFEWGKSVGTVQESDEFISTEQHDNIIKVIESKFETKEEKNSAYKQWCEAFDVTTLKNINITQYNAVLSKLGAA